MGGSSICHEGVSVVPVRGRSPLLPLHLYRFFLVWRYCFCPVRPSFWSLSCCCYPPLTLPCCCHRRILRFRLLLECLFSSLWDCLLCCRRLCVPSPVCLCCSWPSCFLSLPSVLARCVVCLLPLVVRTPISSLFLSGRVVGTCRLFLCLFFLLVLLVRCGRLWMSLSVC